MTSTLLLILPTLITAVQIQISEKPGITLKIYNNPPFIIVDLAQNSYLSISGTPSNISLSKGVPEIIVPPPRESYVWEFTGYLEVETLGIHEFLFTNTDVTTLQIGAGRMCYDDVQESITENIFYMENQPLEIRLEKKTHYPIKIMHLSTKRRVSFLYLKPGASEFTELDVDVFKVEPETSAMGRRSRRGDETFIRGCDPFGIDTPGFELGAYIYDRAEKPVSITFFQNGYERLRKVIDRIIDDPDGHIKSPSAVPKIVAEFSGIIKYPIGGMYTIAVNASQFVSVQIGPGHETVKEEYEIDESWIFADTRDFQTRTFRLNSYYVYPFRVVYLLGETNDDMVLSVVNQEGKEVDLFGLWGSDQVESVGEKKLNKSLDV